MEAVADLEGSSREAITREFPFLEYATQGILYHAEQAQNHDVSQQNFLATFPRSQWVKHHNILEAIKVRRYTSKVSLLYILAKTGMSALIRAHSQRQSCFEVESERYGPPILAASATQNTAVMQTMLELEAERLSESSRLNLHRLMPLSLDIQCASTRSFKFKKRAGLLNQLIEYGNENASLFFLTIERPSIHVKDTRGNTTLMLAIQRGFVLLVERLLQMGTDVLGADPCGETPLYAASYYGHTKVVELLIEHGADIPAADSTEWRPLFIASAGGHTKVVELLISRGANISAANSDGKTPLYIASFHGYTEILELLTDRGADISTDNKNG